MTMAAPVLRLAAGLDMSPQLIAGRAAKPEPGECGQGRYRAVVRAEDATNGTQVRCLCRHDPAMARPGGSGPPPESLMPQAVTRATCPGTPELTFSTGRPRKAALMTVLSGSR